MVEIIEPERCEADEAELKESRQPLSCDQVLSPPSHSTPFQDLKLCPDNSQRKLSEFLTCILISPFPSSRRHMKSPHDTSKPC